MAEKGMVSMSWLADPLMREWMRVHAASQGISMSTLTRRIVQEYAKKVEAESE